MIKMICFSIILIQSYMVYGQDNYKMIQLKKKQIFENNQNDIFKTNLLQDSIKIKNFENAQYTIDLKIGSQMSNVTLILDTGSSKFWVYKITDQYDATKSTSAFISDQYDEIQYAKGFVSGEIGSDIINIGSDFKQINQSLIFVQEAKDIGIYCNGLIGLSNKKQVLNFIDLAYLKGEISSPTFALELKNSTQQSMLYVGGYPNSNETKFLDAYREDFWSIFLLNIQVGDITTDKSDFSSQEAIIDSGTSNILLDTLSYLEFESQLPSNCFQDKNLQIYCPCKENLDEYPKIQIYTQGLKFEIGPLQYLIQQPNGQDPNMCYLAIESQNMLSFVILGDTFMRNYLVVYDKQNNKIGFNGASELGIINKKYIQIIFYLYLSAILLVALVTWTGNYKQNKIQQKMQQSLLNNS